MLVSVTQQKITFVFIGGVDLKENNEGIIQELRITLGVSTTHIARVFFRSCCVAVCYILNNSIIFIEQLGEIWESEDLGGRHFLISRPPLF